MITCASAVEVGVTLVAIGAPAPVSDAVAGVEALAPLAPARVLGGVALGDPAVADVPNRPVEHDGHVEVVGSVEVGAIAVRGVDPLVLHQEHVIAGRRVEAMVDGFLAVLLCRLIQAEDVRLVEVERPRYGVLAAPPLPGAPARQVIITGLRLAAHGYAAADIVLLGVNQVTEDRATEHDEPVPRRGEAVGGATAERHIRQRQLALAVPPQSIVTDVGCAVAAIVSGVDEGPGLAVEGQANQLDFRHEEARRRVGVVANEPEVEVAGTAGANAEWVGDAGVPALVGAARRLLSPRWCHRRQADDQDDEGRTLQAQGSGSHF